MLFELGWVDDADAVGRRAGELCAFVVPLGAGGGGLDTGAGAYDACRGAPTPESFDRCENEKVGTPPLVPPAPGRVRPDPRGGRGGRRAGRGARFLLFLILRAESHLTRVVGWDARGRDCRAPGTASGEVEIGIVEFRLCEESGGVALV